MTSSTSPAARRDFLADRLDTVRGRISVAAPAGAEPTLIVVTKYFPAADVELLAGLGVQDVGENKDQEASAKAVETAHLGLSWHFIGQLQSNKAKSVVRYAAAVHSVDRLALVTALDKAMTTEQQRRADASLPPRDVLDCFLQVDLRNPDQTTPGPGTAAGGPAGAAGRGGALPADLPALAEAVAASPGLRLAGVMAVAPLQADPGAAFARLQALSDRLRTEYPGASGISAGMSRDLEAALAHGATHLRIGSDILGPRPAVR